MADRIVSLLPSATEIVCAVGLQDALVGVTHECDYPPFVRDLPKVTRTLIPTDASSAEIDDLVRQRLQTRRALYSLDLAALEALRPDLIVTQALCDVCAVAEDEVRAAACSLPGGPRVINLEPQNLSQVLEAVQQVGRVAGVERSAVEVVARLEARIAKVVVRTAGLTHRPRVALLEWLDPPFSCGHWTPELVRLAGGVEGLGREGQRSRMLRWEEVVAWRPEVVLVACCGFDVERTLADMPLLRGVEGLRDMPAVQSDRVYVADGSQYFSRPGPRLVDSLEILAHALHPDVHPLPDGLPAAVHACVGEARGGLACELAALDPLQRERRAVLEQWLRNSTVEVIELADGFRFRLDPDSLGARHVEEFVALERLCCPFLRIERRKDADDDGLMLEVGGSEDIKAFVAQQFQLGPQNSKPKPSLKV